MLTNSIESHIITKDEVSKGSNSLNAETSVGKECRNAFLFVLMNFIFRCLDYVDGIIKADLKPLMQVSLPIF